MANNLDININGKDNSKQAFDNLQKSAQRLSAEMKGLGGTLKGVGQVAFTFGSSDLAMAIQAIERAVVSGREMTEVLGRSKLAMVALGAGAGLAGYQVGEMIRKWIPFFNFHDKMEAMIDKSNELQAIQNKIIGTRDPQMGARRQALLDIDNQIEANRRAQGTLGHAASKLMGQDDGLENVGNALVQLRKATNDKFNEEDEKAHQKNLAAWDAFSEQNFIKLQELSNSEVAELQVVERAGEERLEKARNFYLEGIIDQDQFHTAVSVSMDIFEKQKTKITEEQAAKRKEIQDKERRQQLQTIATYLSATASVFGSLAQLAESFGKKNAKLAQAFRYVEAIVNTAAGITRAFADFPYPVSLAVAASVAAAGAAQIAVIANAKPQGQAHAGLDYVPSEGTYILQKGERVVQPKQNVQLQEFLDRGSSGPTVVEVYLDSRVLLRAVAEASNDGRLRINARAIQ